MKSILTALVVAALLPTSALAFTPHTAPARIKTARLFMSDTKESPVDEESSVGTIGGRPWSIGAPSREMVEAEKKKKVAKDALNKLLERQQRDVQQTQELLKNLEEAEHAAEQWDSMVFDENFNVTSLADAAPPITASVAAGADYGFISRSEGCRAESVGGGSPADARFEAYGPPGNLFSLGSQQFMRNLRAMIGEYKDEEDNPALTDRQRRLQAELSRLTLSSEAIWERERSRGPIVAPWIIKAPYFVLCYFLDVVFEGRNSFGRFFLLETVARMPYFSYITMLHLYETLGFWRRSADIKRIHFAEEWNEFHHLLIMESLGGDQPYWVRFLAQHSAVAYYVALCLLWMMSPSLSYKFSEMLETHAVDTYSQFVDENEEKLKELPPSLAAVEYYTVGVSDPMFGEYQTASVSDPGRGVRRPGMDLRSLYDVFCAIRNDEGDHVRTMASCLDPAVATLSPGLESRVLTGVALAAGSSLIFGGGGIEGLSDVGNSLGGLMGVEGLGDLADGATDLDLDSVLMMEDGGVTTDIINAIMAGLAGLANGLQEATGAEGAEVENDVASSALDDLIAAAGGLDGIELGAFGELVKNIILGILELIPFI